MDVKCGDLGICSAPRGGVGIGEVHLILQVFVPSGPSVAHRKDYARFQESFSHGIISGRQWQLL